MTRKLSIIMTAVVVLSLACSAYAQGAPKAPTPSALFAVACHASSTCVAVGPDSSEGQAGTYSVAIAINGGHRWVVRAQTPRMEPGVSISCGGATTCVLAGNLARGDQPITYWTTNGGASWRPRKVPSEVDQLGGISCATEDVCAVFGAPDTSTAAEQIVRVATTLDRGATWVVHYLPRGLDVTVVCASSSRCYLVGQQFANSGGLNSTAVVLRYRVYRHGWHLERKTLLSGLVDISGFGCSSAVRCGGIADHLTKTSPTGGTLHFVSISTTDGGTVWRRGTGPQLFGGWSVSCPSPTICIAGGAGDSSFPGAWILRTTDGGISWSKVNLAASSPYVSITSAACASVHLCFAVGGQRAQPPGDYAVSILISTDGGEDWSVVHSL